MHVRTGVYVCVCVMYMYVCVCVCFHFMFVLVYVCVGVVSKPYSHLSCLVCNSKVLELFERNSLATSLDLSNFDLQPGDSAPLFQALQLQHKLATLSLSGNRLRDEAMPHLLSTMEAVPSLSSLDMASTGITHQVQGVGPLMMLQ